MAHAKSVNQVFGAGTTGASWVWALVATLVAGGWTVTGDSDGTTYSATGGQVTSGASGAHGLGNTDAWVRLSNPAGTLFLTIQRGANNLVWRVKWAQSAFAAGSPGAAQTPSATNENVRLGAGTDASPTFAQWLGQGDAGGYCGDFVVESSAPYRVLAFAYDPSSGTNVHSKFIVDFVQAFRAAGDTCPWAIHCAAGASGADTLHDTVLIDPSSASCPGAWLGNPGTGTCGPVPCVEVFADGANPVAPDGGAVNPLTGAWDLKPLVYERRSGLSAPRGLKGESSMLFWRPAGTHATGDLYNVASTGDAVALSQVVCSLWTGDALTGAAGGTNRGSARLLVPVASDTSPPVIGNWTVTPGDAVSAVEAIGFDVTDDVGVAFVSVDVLLADQATVESAYGGASFRPDYAAGSSVVAITGGYRFVLARAGGWSATPTLDIHAVDTAGNVTP